MHSHTQHPRACSRSPLTHASTGGSWTLTGKSGSVSRWVTVPFSCVLFICALQSLFPQSWRLYVGVNGDFLQEGLYHTQVSCTQSPYACSRPLLMCTSTGDIQTLKGRSDSVSVGSPGVHKVLFDPPRISGGYGVDSKCDFASPTILLKVVKQELARVIINISGISE